MKKYMVEVMESNTLSLKACGFPCRKQMKKQSKDFLKTKPGGKAYKWLSNELKIPVEETHIGWFDVEMCRKVEKICKYYVDKLKL